MIMKKAIELIDTMIEENYDKMQELFVEFIDEVEDDKHILYELQQLGHTRNQLFDLKIIIEEK